MAVVAGLLLITCVLYVPLTLAQLWERSRRKVSFRWERRRGVLTSPGRYYAMQLFLTFPFASGAAIVHQLWRPSTLWSMSVLLALLARVALLTLNLAMELPEYAATGPWRVR